MSDHTTRVQHWRIQILTIGLVVVSLVIFGWTISFQFLPEGDQIRQEGERYQGVWLELKPPRGPIYDRSGYLLAGNKIVYEVGLELQYKGTPEAIARVLNATIGIDYAEALRIAHIEFSEDAIYAQIARDVPAEDAHELINLLEGFYSLISPAPIPRNSWRLT